MPVMESGEMNYPLRQKGIQRSIVKQKADAVALTVFLF